MNKLLVFAVCGVLALASCNRDKKSALNPSEIQSDSLRNIIDARDHEINDMMGTLNDIQQGFAAINEAENRVTIAKNGEAAAHTISGTKLTSTFIPSGKTASDGGVKKWEYDWSSNGVNAN